MTKSRGQGPGPRGAGWAARAALASLAAALGAGGCVGYGLYRPAQPDATEVIEVRLREMEVEPWPRLVRKGRAVFDIENAGTLAHGLEIVGPGLKQPLGEFMSAGSRQQVQVDLAAGTYRIFCPDGNHRARGMEAQVVAAPEAGWFRR